MSTSQRSGFMHRIPLLLLLAGSVILFSSALFSRSFSEPQKSGKNLEAVQYNTQETAAFRPENAVLYGTDTGLYSLDSTSRQTSLLTGTSVKKIIRGSSYWAILGSNGVMLSDNLIDWEKRNNGFPVKTIKTYRNGEKSFEYIVQELKDLARDPRNQDILVSATKDTVFLSRDRGLSWQSLGIPVQTNGIRSVAVASLPELTVFVSHGIYGVHYLEVEKSGARWTELNEGLERLESTNNPDEVAILSTVLPAPKATDVLEEAVPELYAGQSFRGRIYQLDWKEKRFIPIWSDKLDFSSAESLDIGQSGIRFLQEDAIREIDRPRTSNGIQQEKESEQDSIARERNDLANRIRLAADRLDSFPNCVLMPSVNGSGPVQLSELWLLNQHYAQTGTRQAEAFGKEGFYLPVNHARDAGSLAPYLELIDTKGQNSIVIDMKDDYGRLRFTPNNPDISAKGRVFMPVDLESFVSTMKEHGVYLIARIVVFKDPELASKEGGKYAVWDPVLNQAWKGYYERRQKIETEPDTEQPSIDAKDNSAPDEYETVRVYYDENWVDPYSEIVWEYTADISRELIERGFDEIQYDYIRFPTDGINLNEAQFRWKDPGMDKESAILSFLRHVRNEVQAPISIDIYGANGWYRTGARTGQEVELLAPYVDVISPMYYPSHFEQDFLACDPAELRPYRIYYRGTLRTRHIARRKVIVRPYVQAFYLNVSYDRTYYGEEYVRYQVDGVRDAGGPGLTYWNNVGRYDEIPYSDSVRTAKRRDPSGLILD